ncbi:hypothetical protein [Aquimarina hainanensis]
MKNVLSAIKEKGCQNDKRNHGRCQYFRRHPDPVRVYNMLNF